MFSIRKIWVAVVAVVVSLSPTLATPAQAADIGSKARSASEAGVYDRIRPAVVWIVSIRDADGKITGAEGTAWVVDKQNRLLVTNNHVVEGSTRMLVFFPQWKDGKLITDREWYARHGKRIDVRTVVANPVKDLAVVQAEEMPEDAGELRLASNSSTTGDSVFTLGNPGHREELWIENRSVVRAVEWNVIVTKQGSRFEGVYQASGLAISGGASGSPVVNAAGEVVAVIFAGNAVENRPATLTVSVDVTELRKVVAAARDVQTARAGGKAEPADTIERVARGATAAKPAPIAKPKPKAERGTLSSLFEK